LVDCAKVDKQIKSAVNKVRGTHNESNAIAMYEAFLEHHLCRAV